MKSSLLGILALLIAVIALGLAVLPTLAMERPKHIRSTAELPRPIDSRPTLPEAGDAKGVFTIEFEKFSVTVSNQDQKPSPAEQRRQQIMAYHNAGVDRQLARREATIGRFTFAAVCCALLGLIVSPIAWVREKQPLLAGTAMSICCVALFWEYIVIGITIAVVIMLVILFFASVGS